jgi:hypothetical protein
MALKCARRDRSENCRYSFELSVLAANAGYDNNRSVWNISSPHKRVTLGFVSHNNDFLGCLIAPCFESHQSRFQCIGHDFLLFLFRLFEPQQSGGQSAVSTARV